MLNFGGGTTQFTKTPPFGRRSRDALNKPVRNSMGVKEPLLGSTRLKLEVSDRHMGGFLKVVGFPNNHWFSFLKMIILGCFGETPI